MFFNRQDSGPKECRLIWPAGLIGVLLLASGNAQALLIDDFTIVQTLQRTTNGTTSQQSDANTGLAGFQADLTIIGPGSSQSTPVAGWRDLILQRTAGGSGAATNDAIVSISSGSLAVGNEPTVDSTVTVVWDGNDAAGTVLRTGLRVGGFAGQGVDVTDAGASTGFLINLEFADLGTTVEFTLWSGQSGTSGAAATTPTGASKGSVSLPAVSSPTVFYVPFTSINVAVAGIANPVDFTNVGAIQMKLDGSAGWDTIISLLESGPEPIPVPEPTMIMLMGVGLAGLGFARRKSKAS
jgi:hypothetical protein